MKDPSPPPILPPPYDTIAPPLLYPEQEKLRCPRCDSLNTKFCYYNNYNLSQPRHFCKACRRYWTKGGSLRNIPVGGASRKNSKRSSSSKRTSGGSLKSELISDMGSGLPPPMGGSTSSSGGGGGLRDEGSIKGCWNSGESNNIEWGNLANFTPTSTFQ